MEWVVKHYKNLEPIKVQGLTFNVAQQAIEKHVEKFIANPQVIITLDKKTIKEGNFNGKESSNK